MLTSRIVQWIIVNIFRMPWVLLDKNDSRFCVGNKIRYDGDGAAAATTLTTNRNLWTTWIVAKLSETSPAAHIAVDDCFGRRLACLGKTILPGQVVALRVGYEAAEMFFLGPRDPQIILVCRVMEADLPPEAIRL